MNMMPVGRPTDPPARFQKLVNINVTDETKLRIVSIHSTFTTPIVARMHPKMDINNAEKSTTRGKCNFVDKIEHGIQDNHRNHELSLGQNLCSLDRLTPVSVHHVFLRLGVYVWRKKRALQTQNRSATQKFRTKNNPTTLEETQ